jgi:hypothetical protein
MLFPDYLTTPSELWILWSFKYRMAMNDIGKEYDKEVVAYFKVLD